MTYFTIRLTLDRFTKKSIPVGIMTMDRDALIICESEWPKGLDKKYLADMNCLASNLAVNLRKKDKDITTVLSLMPEAFYFKGPYNTNASMYAIFHSITQQRIN